jgi:hypothetical protein
MVQRLSKETLEKIRKEIQSGKSKYQTAGEFGLHPTVVYRRTLDLPGGQYGWPGIRGKTLEILQELMKHGYILCTNFNAGHKYQILKKYFPNICKIHMYKKTILYLDDKASVAARAFLANLDRKIMSFQELKQVTRVFGIELSSEEKHRIIGKPGKRMLPVIRRKDGGFLSSYHKSQSKIDDFNEKEVFPHKSLSAKSRKIQSSNEDSLLTNDDSLIDFYIRMYCPLKIQQLQ